MRTLLLQSPLLLPSVSAQQKRCIFAATAELLEEAVAEGMAASPGGDLHLHIQRKEFLPWLRAGEFAAGALGVSSASPASPAFGHFRVGALRLAAAIDCDALVSMLLDQFLPRL